MLSRLDGDPKLLLSEPTQCGIFCFEKSCLSCQQLRVTSEWTRMREEEGLQVVVHGVSDEYTVFEQVSYSFLHFRESYG